MAAEQNMIQAIAQAAIDPAITAKWQSKKQRTQ